MKSPKCRTNDKLLPFGSPFVLIDHAPISVLNTFADVLAAHEGEAERAPVLTIWRRHRSPHSAPAARRVREAVPIGCCRLQSPDEDAARVIGLTAGERRRRRDDALKRRIFGDFNSQPH